MSRKLPNELDTETLLQIASGDGSDPVEAAEPEYKNDIIDFLLTFNIKSGTELVPAKGLYDLYQQWSKDPLPRRDVGIECNKILIHIGAYYYLNKDAITLSKRAYDQFLKKKKKVNKPINKKYRTHFENFMLAHDLRRGDFWIEGYCLYYLYDKWCHPRQNNPLGPANFRAIASLYFEKTTDRTVTKFRVNTSIKAHLSNEHIKQIKEGVQRRLTRRHYRKEKEPSLRGEISGTRTKPESEDPT